MAKKALAYQHAADEEETVDREIGDGVADEVRNLVALDAPEAADGIFNIGNPLEDHSIDELIETLARVAGRTIRPRYVPFAQPGTARRLPDVSRAERVLALRPRVTLEEGLRTTYEWYAERIADADRLASGP